MIFQVKAIYIRRPPYKFISTVNCLGRNTNPNALKFVLNGNKTGNKITNLQVGCTQIFTPNE